MEKSLGPKPTKNQMEVLKKLADGYEAHYSTGIRFNDSAWLVKPGNLNDRERLQKSVLFKFKSWGWLEPIAPGDFRGCDYRITDTGRKRVEMGEIRK